MGRGDERRSGEKKRDGSGRTGDSVLGKRNGGARPLRGGAIGGSHGGCGGGWGLCGGLLGFVKGLVIKEVTLLVTFLRTI